MNEKLFKRLDYGFGWLVFLIAATVYMLTLEPTVSFWDCGEFISSSNKLQVGHPPGAPFFMLIARFFAMFASGPQQVALMVNAFSGIMSALTIMFLYWSIAYFAKRMIAPDGNYNTGKTIAIIGASMVGALAYTFSDTFWFSAVEGEVYAFSSFFTAIVFWAMLKWSDSTDEKYASRWILLIALLVGMSIGVHLLNLLTIPAIAFVFYFKKFKPNVKGFIITVLTSLLIVAMIMWGIIPGVAVISSKLELLTVNRFGLAYNSGLLLWCFLVLGSFIFSIYLTHNSKNPILSYIFPSLSLILIGAPFMSDSILLNICITLVMIVGAIYLAKKKMQLLNLILLAFTMIIIGYSSYAMIVIRSNANPPMDQNNPEDPFSLLYYLNREQYGDRPLLYGEYFDAEYEIDEATGKVVYDTTASIYVKRDGRYEIVDQKRIPQYKKENCTIFPRMYSSQKDHIEVYKEYGRFKASQTKPEFSNNINYFVSYQLNWMYWRYFMWNFAGRQNDIQGQGNLIHGNWVSGLSFIDNPRLGDQSKLPDYLKNNKANNHYFMLPLLLGLIGLGYQLFKNLKDWWIVCLLFILTGLAIVVYLNQYPNQPRERDYAYAGSFYAFAIWIGLSVVGIYELLKKFSPSLIAGSIATLLCLPVPYIMAKENWNDHNRSNRFIARDFAYNYLMSCAPNAILFTYGDNDTFPIWYAQEVEGVRPDVKVCCLPYFASDWYIDQMKQASYDAAPMPLTIERPNYEPSIRDILYYDPVENPETKFVSLDVLLNFINSKGSSREYNGETIFTYNRNKLFLTVDTLEVVKNKTVKPQDASKIDTVIYFDLNRNYLVKNEMMTLDLLRTNKWERPIYFTNIGGANTLGLNNYFQNEGFAYRLIPIKSDRRGRIDTDIMYDNLMNKFKWGNMNDPNIIIDNTVNNTMRVVKVRDNFKELALLLAKDGDLTRAKKIIARCDELMPLSIYTPAIQDIDYVRAYYAVGEVDKGDNYLRQIVKVTTQELDFYASLDTDKRKKCSYEIQLSLQTYFMVLAYTADPADKEFYEANFRNLVPISFLSNRKKLFDELLPKLSNYSRIFEGLK